MNKLLTAYDVSILVVRDGENSWKLWLFEFVDQFRKTPVYSLIEKEPAKELPERIKCLLAAAVHALCMEKNVHIPPWTLETQSLETPWFVSGYESLKTSALVESPVSFRGKNIFVLGNFLRRV